MMRDYVENYKCYCPVTFGTLFATMHNNVVSETCRFRSDCRGFICSYCMQRAAIPACSNFRLSNVLENIHKAKVLQPMTAFGGIT